MGKSIPHALTLFNTVRNTIKQTKFSWKVEKVTGNLYYKHRLVGLSDLLVVAFEKVLSDRDFLPFTLKSFFDRICVKNNITDNVLALVTPVSNYTFVTELLFASLNPLILRLVTELIFQIKDSWEATISRHKLENGIYDKCTSNLTLQCGGFESRKNFKFTLLKFDDFFCIKKARHFPNLF